MRQGTRRSQPGFTLIELMVTITIIGILAMVVAPSFRQMILMQRLRSINAQMVTDINLARSEAVTRRKWLEVGFKSNASMSCYVLYTGTTGTCNCTRPIGSACDAGSQEVKTVQVPTDLGVTFAPVATIPYSPDIAFDPVSGNLRYAIFNSMAPGMPAAWIQASTTMRGKLDTYISIPGRASVCTPDGSVPGTRVCLPGGG